MEWSFDADRAIYAQLVEQIQRAVVTGVFAPGARLPGVRELAAEAGVNPNTMQRALGELETAGLVYTQRTLGRFVTRDAAQIAALRCALAADVTRRYLAQMTALGCTPADTARYLEQGKEEEGI